MRKTYLRQADGPRDKITPRQWRALRDEPAGPDSLEALTWDDPVACRKRGRVTLREAWQLVGPEILAEWIRERPGTRPSCWWRWDAPRWADPWEGEYFHGTFAEPRQRLGGIGTPAYEALNRVPRFAYGIPVDWVDRWAVSYYTGAMQHVVTGELVNPDATPADFPYDAIDPVDPPTYESQATYLHRLGLLTPGELALYRAGELDTDEETIDLPDDDEED